jgi:hypothetical protein
MTGEVEARADRPIGDLPTGVTTKDGVVALEWAAPCSTLPIMMPEA